jgi:hypothetical protein
MKLKTPPSILTDYCRVARPIMNRFGLAANCCIGATRVSCYCLKRLGFHVAPLATKFVVEAPALELAYSSGLTAAELAQAKTARSVFGPGWNGHLVAHVDGAWLLDSTFDQADDAFTDRPFGLQAECVLFPLEGLKYNHGFHADYRGISDGGVELRVRYVRLDDASWRASDAWNDENLPFIAAYILAELRHQATSEGTA